MTTANKKLVPTVCHSACGLACGLVAHVENGVLTKVEALGTFRLFEKP
jgi:anaerobic selenocysteine-containing dehydrogenase